MALQPNKKTNQQLIEDANREAMAAPAAASSASKPTASPQVTPATAKTAPAPSPLRPAIRPAAVVDAASTATAKPKEPTLTPFVIPSAGKKKPQERETKMSDGNYTYGLHEALTGTLTPRTEDVEGKNKRKSPLDDEHEIDRQTGKPTAPPLPAKPKTPKRASDEAGTLAESVGAYKQGDGIIKAPQPNKSLGEAKINKEYGFVGETREQVQARLRRNEIGFDTMYDEASVIASAQNDLLTGRDISTRTERLNEVNARSDALIQRFEGAIKYLDEHKAEYSPEDYAALRSSYETTLSTLRSNRTLVDEAYNEYSTIRSYTSDPLTADTWAKRGQQLWENQNRTVRGTTVETSKKLLSCTEEQRKNFFALYANHPQYAYDYLNNVAFENAVEQYKKNMTFLQNASHRDAEYYNTQLDRAFNSGDYESAATWMQIAMFYAPLTDTSRKQTIRSADWYDNILGKFAEAGQYQYITRLLTTAAAVDMNEKERDAFDKLVEKYVVDNSTLGEEDVRKLFSLDSYNYTSDQQKEATSIYARLVALSYVSNGVTEADHVNRLKADIETYEKKNGVSLPDLEYSITTANYQGGQIRNTQGVSAKNIGEILRAISGDVNEAATAVTKEYLATTAEDIIGLRDKVVKSNEAQQNVNYIIHNATDEEKKVMAEYVYTQYLRDFYENGYELFGGGQGWLKDITQDGATEEVAKNPLAILQMFFGDDAQEMLDATDGLGVDFLLERYDTDNIGTALSRFYNDDQTFGGAKTRFQDASNVSKDKKLYDAFASLLSNSYDVADAQWDQMNDESINRAMDSFGERLWKTPVTILTGTVTKPLSGFMSLAGVISGGEGYHSMAGRFQQAGAQNIQAAHPGFGGKALSFAYNTSISIVESRLNQLVFGKAGTFVMGLSAAGEAAADATDRGASSEQALVIGLIAGAAEVFTESRQFERFTKMLEDTDSAKSLLAGIVDSMKQEGIEEVASEIIDITADALIAGDKSANAQEIKRLMREEDMTYAEAAHEVALNSVKQVALAFAGGALSGGVSAGFGGAVGYIQNTRANKAQFGADYISALQKAQASGDLEAATEAANALSVYGGLEITAEDILAGKYDPNVVIAAAGKVYTEAMKVSRKVDKVKRFVRNNVNVQELSKEDRAKMNAAKLMDEADGTGAMQYNLIAEAAGVTSEDSNADIQSKLTQYYLAHDGEDTVALAQEANAEQVQSSNPDAEVRGKDNGYYQTVYEAVQEDSAARRYSDAILRMIENNAVTENDVKLFSLTTNAESNEGIAALRAVFGKTIDKANDVATARGALQQMVEAYNNGTLQQEQVATEPTVTQGEVNATPNAETTESETPAYDHEAGVDTERRGPVMPTFQETAPPMIPQTIAQKQQAQQVQTEQTEQPAPVAQPATQQSYLSAETVKLSDKREAFVHSLPLGMNYNNFRIAYLSKYKNAETNEVVAAFERYQQTTDTEQKASPIRSSAKDTQTEQKTEKPKPTIKSAAAVRATENEVARKRGGLVQDKVSDTVAKRYRQTADDLGKLFGVAIRFDTEQSNPLLVGKNGYYDSKTGEIVLNVSMEHDGDFDSAAYVEIMGHEVTHLAKDIIGKEAFGRLADYAVQLKGGNDAVKQLAAKMQGRGMTEAKAIEYAKEELTCDFVGEVLGASSLMDKFCADIRSGAVEREAATGLVGAVKRFLAKITGKATSQSTQAMRNRIMSMYGANIEQAEKAVREIQKALAQASKQQSNLLNDGVDGATIKENHLRFSNKYWVPNLNSQEWNLLNYTAEKEISSSDKYISETAKWLFADSKGTTVFAVYGIGDGASPTVLYAVGGEKAFTANAKLQSLLEAKNGIIRNRTALDRVLNDILNRDGNESNGTFNAGNRKTRTGNVQVFAGEREGNGEGYSGESEKNQQRNSISVDNIRYSEKDTAPDANRATSDTAQQSTEKKPARIWSKSEVDKLKQQAEQKYGTIEQGETPARQYTIPRKMNDDTKVRRTVRTAAEAGITTDATLEKIDEALVQNAFNYQPKHNQETMDKAHEWVDTFRDANEAYDNWSKEIAKGSMSADNVARGWLLYNNFVTASEVAQSEYEHNDLLKKAVDIIQSIGTMSTVAGQTVQANRMLKKMSPEMQHYALENAVRKLQADINERFTNGKVELKIDDGLLSRWLQALRNGDTTLAADYEELIMQNIAKQVPKTWQSRIDAWRYLSMLGNPITLIRNALGNAVFMPAKMLRNQIGALLELTIEKDKRTKHIGPLRASAQGRALLAYASEDRLRPDVQRRMDRAKYNDGNPSDRLRALISEEGRKFNAPVLKQWQQATTFLMEKMPGMGDTFYKNVHYQQSFARAAMARGYTVEDIRSGKVTEKQLDDLRDYAAAQALKATFNDANAVSDFMARLHFKETGDHAKLKKAVNIGIEGVLPFKRTPANVLVRGFEYSPLGLFKALTADAIAVKKGTITTSEYIERLANGLTGVGIWALGWLASSLGFITVKLDDDDDKLKGKQNYSLELFGKSVSLDWVAPISIPFFMGAEMKAIIDNAADEDTSAKFGDVLLASAADILSPMLEMSMLSGVQDLLDTAVSGSYKNGVDAGKMVAAFVVQPAFSYLGQFVPTLLGQFANATEPYRTQTYVNGEDGVFTKLLKKNIAKITEKIPGVDLWQIDYVDAWGRKDKNTLGERIGYFINPAYVNTITITAADEEIDRLREATDEDLTPSKRNKYITVAEYDENGKKIEGSDKKIHLTGEQYNKYQTEYGRQYSAMITAMLSTKYYNDLPDDEKVKVLQDIESLADKYGRLAAGVGYDVEPGTQDAKIMELVQEQKLPVSDVFMSKLLYTAISDTDDIATEEKTNRFATFVEEQGWTAEQRAAIYKYSFSKSAPQIADFDATAKDVDDYRNIQSQYTEEMLHEVLNSDEYKNADADMQALMVKEAMDVVNFKAKRDWAMERGLADENYDPETVENKINSLVESGVSFYDAVTAHAKYTEIDNMKDADGKRLSATMRAIEYAKWVDEQKWSKKQKDLIRDTYKTYQNMPVEPQTYDKYIGLGFDPDQAYAMTMALAGKQNDNEKFHAAISVKGMSDADKWTALRGVKSGDSNKGIRDKMAAMEAAGISAEFYVSYVDAKSKAGDDHQFNQAELGAWLDSQVNAFRITIEQAAVIWRNTNASWKSGYVYGQYS